MKEDLLRKKIGEIEGTLVDIQEEPMIDGAYNAWALDSVYDEDDEDGGFIGTFIIFKNDDDETILNKIDELAKMNPPMTLEPYSNTKEYQINKIVELSDSDSDYQF